MFQYHYKLIKNYNNLSEKLPGSFKFPYKVLQISRFCCYFYNCCVKIEIALDRYTDFSVRDQFSAPNDFESNLLAYWVEMQIKNLKPFIYTRPTHTNTFMFHNFECILKCLLFWCFFGVINRMFFVKIGSLQYQ